MAVANRKSRNITTFIDNEGQLTQAGDFSVAPVGYPRDLSFKPISDKERHKLENMIAGQASS